MIDNELKGLVVSTVISQREITKLFKETDIQFKESAKQIYELGK